MIRPLRAAHARLAVALWLSPVLVALLMLHRGCS